MELNNLNSASVKVTLDKQITNLHNIQLANKEISEFNEALIREFCEKKELSFDDDDDYNFAKKKLANELQHEQDYNKLLDELLQNFANSLQLPYLILNVKQEQNGEFKIAYLLNQTEKSNLKTNKKASLYFTSKENLIDYLIDCENQTATVVCIYDQREQQVTITLKNFLEKLQASFKSLGKTDFTGFNIYRATKKLA